MLDCYSVCRWHHLGRKNTFYQHHQQIQKYIPYRNREHSSIHTSRHKHKTESRYVHHKRPANFIDSIITILLNSEQVSNLQRKLTENEKSLLRSAIRQLSWLANISRLEISFQVSNISSKIVDATKSDIKEINKIVKFAKENKFLITFPSLHL